MVCKLRRLKELNLRGTMLEGTLPKGMEGLGELEMLDISGTEIQRPLIFERCGEVRLEGKGRVAGFFKLVRMRREGEIRFVIGMLMEKGLNNDVGEVVIEYLGGIIKNRGTYEI